MKYFKAREWWTQSSGSQGKVCQKTSLGLCNIGTVLANYCPKEVFRVVGCSCCSYTLVNTDAVFKFPFNLALAKIA